MSVCVCVCACASLFVSLSLSLSLYIYICVCVCVCVSLLDFHIVFKCPFPEVSCIKPAYIYKRVRTCVSN
jgi:hypothetical protein